MAEFAVRGYFYQSDEYLAKKCTIGRLWGLFGVGVGPSGCLPFSFRVVA